VSFEDGYFDYTGKFLNINQIAPKIIKLVAKFDNCGKLWEIY
jgi:hypothetical protein